MAIISKEEIKAAGQRIKRIRFENSMDQPTFGWQLDPPASASNVSRWERGINLPSKERLSQIAELGDVSVEYLLHGSNLKMSKIDILNDKLRKGIATEKEKQQLNELLTERNVRREYYVSKVWNQIANATDPATLSPELFPFMIYVSTFLNNNKKTKENEPILKSLSTLIRSINSYQTGKINKDELFNAIDDLKNAILKDDSNG